MADESFSVSGRAFFGGGSFCVGAECNDLRLCEVILAVNYRGKLLLTFDVKGQRCKEFDIEISGGLQFSSKALVCLNDLKTIGTSDASYMPRNRAIKRVYGLRRFLY